MGSLLDDPVYSDVEFIIPRYPNNLRNARTIWASKKMLQRIDYFDASNCRSFRKQIGFASINKQTLTVFSSNFAEGTSSAPVATLLSTCQHTNTKGDTDYFEDSDQEDEDPEDNDSNMDEDDPQSHTEDSFIACLTAINPPKNDDNPMLETSSADDQSIAESVMLIPSTGASQITELVAKDPGPQDTAKIKVVVRDTAYSTYRAVLFYVCILVLVPLISKFCHRYTPTLSFFPHSRHLLHCKTRHHHPCLPQMCLQTRWGLVLVLESQGILFRPRCLGRSGLKNGVRAITGSQRLAQRKRCTD